MGRADAVSGPSQVIGARRLPKQGMMELLSLHDLPCDFPRSLDDYCGYRNGCYNT